MISICTKTLSSTGALKDDVLPPWVVGTHNSPYILCGQLGTLNPHIAILFYLKIGKTKK